MRLFFSVFLALVFFVAPAAQGADQVQPWSEKVFQHVEERYGKPAEQRFRHLHGLIMANQNLPVMEKLALVNRTMNNLPWIADQAHWKKADYWATPMETIATFGGDCEDMAIAKWVMLRHLGIADKHFRLAYAKVRKTGESHMVLLYIDRPELPWERRKVYVLDSAIPEIKRGLQRMDLQAIFLVDADGGLVLLSDNGVGRAVKATYQKREMERLEGLKRELDKQYRFARELNDGRPLLPEIKE